MRAAESTCMAARYSCVAAATNCQQQLPLCCRAIAWCCMLNMMAYNCHTIATVAANAPAWTSMQKKVHNIKLAQHAAQQYADIHLTTTTSVQQNHLYA